MNIKINETTSLELINESHSQAIFNLVDKNRFPLRKWLPFVDRMRTLITKNKLNYIKPI